MNTRFIDLTGQTFGKITALELSHMTKNGSYWKCKCDCGSKKIFIVSGKNIRYGKVLSCGCLNAENGIRRRDDLLGKVFGYLTVVDSIKKGNLFRWVCVCSCENPEKVIAQGCLLKSGKIKSCGCFRRRRLAFGENAFNRLFGGYKGKSIKKGMIFELSKEEFKELTKRNCYYCGREPFQKTPPTIKGFGHYIYNGVDRLDNNKGYTSENS